MLAMVLNGKVGFHASVMVGMARREESRDVDLNSREEQIMGNTAQQAYDAIKKLEAEGKLPPSPRLQSS